MNIKKQITLLATSALLILIAYQQGTASNQDKKTTSSNKAYQEYNNALRELWTNVYKNKGQTLYCNIPFSTRSRQERSKADVNAEHIFPMSWAAKDLQCGKRKQCQRESALFRTIESDLHNIYPAQRIVNKARSNYRFGSISGEKREFGSCDFEINNKSRIAEPAKSKRGEIARSMRYLANQYNLSLHKKTQLLMKQWDKEDPPTNEEKRRERIIRKIQGRENKFITQHPYTP